MNHLLLDSHILLWLVEPGTKQLPARAKALISDAASVHFSIGSLWEIAIKAAKRQFVIGLDILSAAIDQARLLELTVKRRHIRMLHTLGLRHHDPFDRMLVAQALTEPLHLLTSNEKLGLYSDLVVLI
ncbi:MAG TPA: type II toxin-antitoxin system VapC family toxin [Xanthobacteraceae bacterium]|jgi:PIN domain nuclease of toxin-antitoxin system|nr:type II toxin-antitoxin system VapC family toxin [Xanthobacteraceae bacterium]